MADNDLQTSLQGDQAQSDSIYPDTRRMHLQRRVRRARRYALRHPTMLSSTANIL
jgi:hypothetical protein